VSVVVRATSAAPPLAEESAGRPRHPSVVPAAFAAGAIGAFFLLHVILALRSQHAIWQFYSRLRGEAFARQIVGSIWPDLLSAMALFVGIELLGLALAARGRSRTFWIPALICVLTPAFVGNVTLIGRTPATLGPGWIDPFALSMRTPHLAIVVWLGAAMDLGLALLPATALALRPRASGSEHPAAVEPMVRAAALALCLFALWLALSARATAFDARFPWADVPTMLPLFLFGLLLGASRPARPWLWTLAVVPVLVVTSWPDALLNYSGVPVRTTVAKSLPWVAVTLLGAAPQPLGKALRWLRDRPVLLLIAVNALNVADAILTFAEVHRGGVVEANPVINVIGLPAKIVLVGAFSVVLARRRPRALVWPALILVGVLGWHLAGLYLNAQVG